MSAAYDGPEPDDEGPEPTHIGQQGRGAAAPPADREAERAVLGAMLLSETAITDVLPILRPEDYYWPQHEAIHAAIVDLFATGQPADAVTVSAALAARGDLDRLGGPGYLFDLTVDVPIVANAPAYAARVAEQAALRNLRTSLLAGLQRIDQGGDTTEVVNTVQADVASAVRARGEDETRPISSIVTETMDHIQALSSPDRTPGVSTGFRDLDDLVGGWQPGQMIVVAGRPGSGKSTLALDFARASALTQRLPTVICSLEMSRQEVTTRLFSAEAKVPLQNLRSGHVSDGDWARMAAIMHRVESAPLWIDDSPNLTMVDIRAKSRRLHQSTGGLGLIVIDYLQLMSSGKRVESRQQEVSEFSRQIKLLAKELEVPVIALSQLNRGPEQRTDKRPVLSDLRESGAIEQDSDIVILVSRPDMYSTESDRLGEADLIVAKHRNGPTRDVVTAFQGHYSRFVDMAH